MPKFVQLFGEEVRRTFIVKRRYWANELSLSVTVYLFFVIVVAMGGAMSGTALSPEYKAQALLGMLLWQFSLGCMGVLGWGFFNEAAVGTLEHLCLSPLGVTAIFLARSVADFLTMVIETGISAALAMLTTGVRLHFPPLETAVILPLAVLGTYGFGFMLAALTLTVKRTQAVMQLMQFFFMFFSGLLVPLQQMHWTIQAFGRTLPLTAGLEALRTVTIGQGTLTDITGLLAQMLVSSAVWLAIGIAVYTVADRRARLHGSIGQY